jgi:hypothetical protein
MMISLDIFPQTAPFNIAIEPLNIAGVGGLQSYAFGQHDGKWLIIGGRLDGLHQRQPFASFDITGHNTQLFVIDPVGMQSWTAPLTSLSTALQEQLQSTNMEFYQRGDFLYIVGGYGYSGTLDDHTTYDKLIAIDVPSAISSIISNTSLTACFRQISDPVFQVTGGRLEQINNTFYLVGGQKFIGRYNPQGPSHGPGFTQEYTNQIRRFTMTDDGTNMTITHLPAITDTINLHRRDYNVSPQIMPNGQEGLTAFSGVFQTIADLPFLNCVNIDSQVHQVNNAFTQYYNHYHCAHLPVYSATQNEMHTLFFGGIAQYYDSAGILVQDDNVPFVKTIARVTRNSAGIMAEYKLPVAMPAFLGAGAEFIPIEAIPAYPNGVVKLDSLTADTTLVGYIYGGISSTAPNVFWINDGSQSSASSQLFKVFLIKNGAIGIHELNEHSTGTLKLTVYPNPNSGNFTVKYQLTQPCDARLTLRSMDGRILEDTLLTHRPAGLNTFRKNIREVTNGGTFLLILETPYEKAVQKIIVED